jgi:sulfite exporter TauE/SafE
MTPYLIQLAAIGFLWVSLHCVGMCGPIVAGLNAAHDEGDGSESRWWRFSRGARRIIAYQSGRAVTYAVFGALAGVVGASVETVIGQIGDVAALVTGGVLVGLGGYRLVVSGSQGPGGIGQRLGGAARRLSRLLPNRGPIRFAVLGLVMGFLPCMLMFWVLGLAASTADPLTGAALMVGLVAMTTPVLILAGAGPLVAEGPFRRHGDTITSAALAVSGVWLLLVGAAANGWVPHAAVDLELAGRTFKMMFW